MTARILLLAAVLALAACGGGGGGAGGIALAPVAPTPAPAPAKAPQGCSVTLYGDSIMAGNGDAETPGLTLQRLRPSFSVDNRAVAGTSLAALEGGFYNELRFTRYVVIENGNIDSWWGGFDVAGFEARLRRMVDFVKAEGRVPVLTGYSRIWPRPGTPQAFVTLATMSQREAYDAAAKQVAADAGIQFADWNAAPFAGPSDLLDEIHPGKAYSDRMVERLALALDRAAPECAP